MSVVRSSLLWYVRSRQRIMTSDSHDLTQHCLDTDEFLTVQIHDHYFLLHQNVVQSSNKHPLGLGKRPFIPLIFVTSDHCIELPPTILRRIFPSDPSALQDAQIVPRVDASLYDIIIFADKSAVYTRPTAVCGTRKPCKRLPYYVPEDLELLSKIGMSKEDIDRFVQKLHERRSPIDQYDHIIQRIIDATDVSTRLRCRQVSRKWRMFVDQSPSVGEWLMSIPCIVRIAVDLCKTIPTSPLRRPSIGILSKHRRTRTGKS